METNPFRDITVGVIGDIIADAYVYGKQHKLSREAPIIVAKYEGEDTFLGGAGNVINNLSSLGAKVRPVSVLGTDKMGESLRDWFEYFLINIDDIIFTNERNTPTKTRYLVGDSHTTKRQVVRFDRISHEPISLKIGSQLLDKIKHLDKLVDIWIVSDYGCGVLTQAVILAVQSLALKSKALGLKKKVIVDSRHSLGLYKGVTYLTPNESELKEVMIADTQYPISTIVDLIYALKIEGLLVTQGCNGMTLYNKDGSFTKIPACNSRDIVDVTGAGDTVTSMFALGLASGLTPLESAKLANYGASLVVMKNGPATVREDELTGYEN